MKRFRGAAEDLGGDRLKERSAKLMKTTRKAAPDGDGINPGVGSNWFSAAASTKTGRGETALAGGGLDNLDCQLGRALAEAWLQNGASREVKSDVAHSVLRAHDSQI